jgi:hypothetical protein
LLIGEEILIKPPIKVNDNENALPRDLMGFDHLIPNNFPAKYLRSSSFII